ncbi:MAG: HEAT repeat domain-containing protein [Phycisphaerales bacterium]|nr:HEAT repeat domain-containing protein [Phycisphaerales bacterium]
MIDYDHSYTPAELIEQLRDDDIRRNLISAKSALLTHPDLTPEILYDALSHEDWQVRQVVCQIIWESAEDRRIFIAAPLKDGKWNGGHWESVDADPRYEITPELISVTIEGLKDDTTPIDHARRRGLVYFNASFGVSKLIPIAHEWRHHIERAMYSDDPQQRFLAAYILGRAGVDQSIGKACEILLPHLRDNDIPEDAKWAVYALGGFGPPILPILRDALADADDQQRSLIQLLMANLLDPPMTESEFRDRARYNSITTTVSDPASQQSASYWSWLGILQD